MTTIKQATRNQKEIAIITQEMKNPIFSSFATTMNNYHRGYDSGRTMKDSNVRWDCSELSANIMQDSIKNMRNTGVQWKTDLNSLSKAFEIGSTTWNQKPALDNMKIPAITGKSNIMHSELKPGMVIYMTYPSRGKNKGWEGHVATVTRNPETGELMIAESFGNKKGVNGVVHRPVNEFFTKGYAVNHAKCKMSLYDPFYKDRETLDKMDQKAQLISKHYDEAVQAYNKHGGAYHKVGLNQKQQRTEFIKNYLENKIEGNDKSLQLQVTQNGNGIGILNLATLEKINNASLSYSNSASFDLASINKNNTLIQALASYKPNENYGTQQQLDERLLDRPSTPKLQMT